MPKCTECNMDAQTGLDVCWYHNPETTEEEKRLARSRGGYSSRRLDVTIDKETVLPIRNVDDLKVFFNAIISDLWDTSNTPARAKALADIGSKMRDVFELEYYVELSERLRILEAKEVPQIESGHYEQS